jgi:hypothetical protein
MRLAEVVSKLGTLFVVVKTVSTDKEGNVCSLGMGNAGEYMRLTSESCDSSECSKHTAAAADALTRALGGCIKKVGRKF